MAQDPTTRNRVCLPLVGLSGLMLRRMDGMPVVWIPQSYSSMHTYKRNGMASSNIGFRAIPIPIPCQPLRLCSVSWTSIVSFLIFEIRVVLTPLCVCTRVCVPNVRFFLIFIALLSMRKHTYARLKGGSYVCCLTTRMIFGCLSTCYHHI